MHATVIQKKPEWKYVKNDAIFAYKQWLLSIDMKTGPRIDRSIWHLTCDILWNVSASQTFTYENSRFPAFVLRHFPPQIQKSTSRGCLKNMSHSWNQRNVPFLGTQKVRHFVFKHLLYLKLWQQRALMSSCPKEQHKHLTSHMWHFVKLTASQTFTF